MRILKELRLEVCVSSLADMSPSSKGLQLTCFGSAVGNSNNRRKYTVYPAKIVGVAVRHQPTVKL
jgi:hypothetical protein